jgi:hypothetical protein
MDEQFHFDDLTSYTHQIAPFVMNGVKNVGWLNFADDFPKGEVAPEIFEKLKIIAGGSDVFRPLVEPLRESPKCPVCGELELLGVNGRALPNAELWIPSAECIYASPIAILHYIEFHDYLPPAKYVAAITELDLSTPFAANAIYREKLVSSGWFNRAR